MHWFEKRFASLGRCIDQVIERMRARRPVRFRPRLSPSIGERIRDRLHGAKTAIATGEWREHAEIGELGRRRMMVLGSVLLVTLAASGAYHLIRPGPPRLNEQEIMDLAMVKARIELGATVGTASDKPFGAFGAAPDATSKPAGALSPSPRSVGGTGSSQMPLPVRQGPR